MFVISSPLSAFTMFYLTCSAFVVPWYKQQYHGFEALVQVAIPRLGIAALPSKRDRTQSPEILQELKNKNKISSATTSPEILQEL